MPLQKILFKPGVNKENTRYTTEGGWYEATRCAFVKAIQKLLVDGNAYLRILT
jgi:hypothetical protein